MAKFKKRLAARVLRKKGWSIRSIAKHLNVSKASASIWCRDLELTITQRGKLIRNAIRAGHAGRIKGALANRQKKEARIVFHKEAGKKEITLLSFKDILLVGVALYWAEGSRKSRFAFTNSEPEMIAFVASWLEHVLGIKREEFMPRIFINAIHKPRIGKVLYFWSHLLRVPVRQFGNPVFLKRPPRKVYENHDSYYGVLALGVRRSSELKYRVLGLIDGLKSAEKGLPA